MPDGPAVVLDQLLAHYSGTTWLALLRALEVTRFRAVRGGCRPPVLDLGCGDGYVSTLALGVPVDAGVDVDGAVLARAAARGGFRLLAQADARRLPFASGVFRTVYSNGAMEHMDDLDAVLGEVSRVLAPGGVLAALVPSDKFRGPVGWLGVGLGRRVWTAYHRLHRHVNLLSEDEWRRRLLRHALMVRRVERYGGDAIAGFVCARDLWSKLHVMRTPPFVGLRHGGRLGRLMPATSPARLRRLLASDRTSDGAGYWMLIVAERTPGHGR